MSTGAIEQRAYNDPMLTRTALEHDAIFFPYGFPARIRSNAAVILQAAEVSWTTYRQRFDEPPLDIRLLVAESASPARHDPPVFRSQRHLMSIVGDSENFASLDFPQATIR